MRGNARSCPYNPSVRVGAVKSSEPTKPLHPPPHLQIISGFEVAAARESMKKESGRHSEYDQRRSSARERGCTTRWDRARKTYLAHNLLCVIRKREVRVSPTTVVDHIKPHKGAQALF
jgi:hypothetical protein